MPTVNPSYEDRSPYFRAKFDGRCASCGLNINEGDWIRLVEGQPVCKPCLEDEAEEERSR